MHDIYRSGKEMLSACHTFQGSHGDTLPYTPRQVLVNRYLVFSKIWFMQKDLGFLTPKKVRVCLFVVGNVFRKNYRIILCRKEKQYYKKLRTKTKLQHSRRDESEFVRHTVSKR